MKKMVSLIKISDSLIVNTVKSSFKESQQSHICCHKPGKFNDNCTEDALLWGIYIPKIGGSLLHTKFHLHRCNMSPV